MSNVKELLSSLVCWWTIALIVWRFYISSLVGATTSSQSNISHDGRATLFWNSAAPGELLQNLDNLMATTYNFNIPPAKPTTSAPARTLSLNESQRDGRGRQPRNYLMDRQFTGLTPVRRRMDDFGQIEEVTPVATKPEPYNYDKAYDEFVKKYFSDSLYKAGAVNADGQRRDYTASYQDEGEEDEEEGGKVDTHHHHHYSDHDHHHDYHEEEHDDEEDNESKQHSKYHDSHHDDYGVDDDNKSVARLIGKSEAALLEPHEPIIMASRKKSQKKRCKTVKRDHQKCMICKNPRNGETSESCSYNKQSTPHDYSYEKKKNFSKKNGKPKITRDSSEDESQEQEEKKSNTSGVGSKMKGRTRSNKGAGSGLAKKPLETIKCTIKKKRHKTCYDCINSAGEQMYKCYVQTVTTGKPLLVEEPYQTQQVSIVAPPKQGKKFHQRIHKRTVTYTVENLPNGAFNSSANWLSAKPQSW